MRRLGGVGLLASFGALASFVALGWLFAGSDDPGSELVPRAAMPVDDERRGPDVARFCASVADGQPDGEEIREACLAGVKSGLDEMGGDTSPGKALDMLSRLQRRLEELREEVRRGEMDERSNERGPGTRR